MYAYLFNWQAKNELENDSSCQDAKVAEVRVALGPLSGRSLKYCTDASLRRYLEANNWDVEKSKKMVEESLKWRSSYKPEEIVWPEVAPEGETGKVFRANFHDKLGRTVLILRPGMQNTTSPEDQIRHLVYLMENAILNHPEGAEHMSWLVDFTGFSMMSGVTYKTVRDFGHILQNHYPQMLAITFMYNPPGIFQNLFKAAKYCLDTKTAEKVKFVYPNDKESEEAFKSLFDEENLPAEFGGKATLKYDHEEFSRLMLEDDVKKSKFWGIGDDEKAAEDIIKNVMEMATESEVV